MSSRSVAEMNKLELMANLAMYFLSSYHDTELVDDPSIHRSMGVARKVSSVVKTDKGFWDLTIDLNPGERLPLMVTHMLGADDDNPTVFWEELPDDGINVAWLHALLAPTQLELPIEPKQLPLTFPRHPMDGVPESD